MSRFPYTELATKLGWAARATRTARLLLSVAGPRALIRANMAR